jgi:Lhr-like helicase
LKTNEMQEAAQETILNDNNVLLLSPTGSGK